MFGVRIQDTCLFYASVQLLIRLKQMITDVECSVSICILRVYNYYCDDDDYYYYFYFYFFIFFFIIFFFFFSLLSL